MAKKKETPKTSKVVEVSMEPKEKQRIFYETKSIFTSSIYEVLEKADWLKESYEHELPKPNGKRKEPTDNGLLSKIMNSPEYAELVTYHNIFKLRLSQKKMMSNLTANVKKIEMSGQLKDAIFNFGKEITIELRSLIQDELIGKVIKLPNRTDLSIITNVSYICKPLLSAEQLNNVTEVDLMRLNHEIHLGNETYDLPVIAIYDAEINLPVCNLYPTLACVDIKSPDRDGKNHPIIKEERVDCSDFRYYNIYPVDLLEACLLNIVGLV